MASINDVYKKLLKIESLIKKVKKEEDIIEKDEKEDVRLAKEGVGLLQKLGKKTKKRYSGIMSWKSNVWDDCKNKKEVSRKGEVDFVCKITNKTCRFLDCPSNIP